MKDKKNIIFLCVIIGVIVVSICGTLIYVNYSKSSTLNGNSKKTTNNSVEKDIQTELDINFKEQYADILDRYFNYQSIPINSYDGLKANTKLYKEAMISFKFYVKKVIEEHDDNYKILVVLVDEYVNSEDQLIVIEGKYENGNRLSEEQGVMYKAYGIYKKMENYTVDGVNYVLPKIEIDRVIKQGEHGIPDIYTQSEIRNVAKKFFNNASVTVADGGPTAEDIEKGIWNPYYISTLHSSGNTMFNKFKFYSDDGFVAVTPEKDEGDVKRFISKASDGKKYIVTTYTTDYLEIQLYDSNFKEIWSREFENVERYSWDNNHNRIGLVVNNDLYFIDEKTGKDVVEPFIVGKGLGIRVLSNGDAIYITDQTKDFIMYINSKGKVVWRNDTDSEPYYVESILVGNNNIYVSYDLGYEDGYNSSYIAVYTGSGDVVAKTTR